ncbi:HEAT domain containing protein [Methanobacterium lacus]|uniref:HEAT domain containing protein n=1 Tax=Methanobacterium lacus (strain AL-21) TaxID=877455 RepID=F0TCT3_METLA|nr:HEAT repeat domain-containing protein [Methanobacterium lacus]ADZ10473.1 HEAT domain containing protein [Methanobacterium lacus]
MGFYDLSKDERSKLVKQIHDEIEESILNAKFDGDGNSSAPEILVQYASNEDGYIRKAAYNAVAKIYLENNDLHKKILTIMAELLNNSNPKVRQTAVYVLGEIGTKDITDILVIFETALTDEHHSVRNAVIGALKRMGQRNPKQTFKFASKHIQSKNPMIRREIVHGIELRGRTHPEEVMPILKKLEYEEDKAVKQMIIHVIGQISYKKGCLEVVVRDLNDWSNKGLVLEAFKEIVEVHENYKFATRTPEQAKNYIKKNLETKNLNLEEF